MSRNNRAKTISNQLPEIQSNSTSPERQKKTSPIDSEYATLPNIGGD
jgi:hypothetical protein